jgi:hypothetical protein
MNKIVIAAIAGISFILPGYALAQSTPQIDKRQERQDERIERGIQKGQITKKEARRLEKGQEHIENMEEKALRDGKLTKREKSQIDKAQDKQNKRIYNQRHDEQGKVAR